MVNCESDEKREGLLKGFRALDLTDQQGFACGKILAALGIDVIKIEQSGGDPARAIPPFYGDTTDAQKSLYWEAFNTDKRGITLNIRNAEAQELFKRLVERADFVLESFKPGTMESLGIGYDILSGLNQRIILVSITPFGQKGPYSGFKASDLVISAMGGIMDNTGDSDRAPLKESLEACYYHGNVAAAVGAVIAHYFRETTGQGQQVDVSLHEVAASRNAINFIQWEFDRRLTKRSGASTQYGGMKVRTVWPCRDGYVSWMIIAGIMGEASNLALSRWMDDDGLPNPLHEVTDWKAVDLPTLGRETIDRFESAIGAFFLKHTKKELREEGLRRRINAAVLDGPDDILDNIQLQARRYFTDVEYPEWGRTLRYPGYFFLCSETENLIRRRAPRVGEHNHEIYVEEMGLSAAEVTALVASGTI